MSGQKKQLKFILYKKTYVLGLLLELLDGPLVNASALVDEVTSGGGLAGVHVANDDDVDVNLFLAHFSRFFSDLLQQR